MNGLGFKFSLYDFLGYFLPGLIFLILSYFTKWQFGGKDIVSFGNEIIKVGKEMNIYITILIVIISYIIGHMISTVSLSIERISCEILRIENILTKNLYSAFKNKFKDMLGVSFQHNEEYHICIPYIIANEPNVYNRVFVFLNIYGMCRSISFVFAFFEIIQLTMCLKGNGSINIVIIDALICGVFFVEYIIFLRHYYREIYTAFTICESNK